MRQARAWPGLLVALALAFAATPVAVALGEFVSKPSQSFPLPDAIRPWVCQVNFGDPAQSVDDAFYLALRSSPPNETGRPQNLDVRLTPAFGNAAGTLVWDQHDIERRASFAGRCFSPSWGVVDVNNNHGYDNGDWVVLDSGSPGNVVNPLSGAAAGFSGGDLRITPIGSKAAGTLVVMGDPDLTERKGDFASGSGFPAFELRYEDKDRSRTFNAADRLLLVSTGANRPTIQLVGSESGTPAPPPATTPPAPTPITPPSPPPSPVSTPPSPPPPAPPTFTVVPTPTLAAVIAPPVVNLMEVSIDGRSSTGGSRIVEYRWDWGDGQTTFGPTARHRYERPGEYLVKLTITDAAGSAATASMTVEPAESLERSSLTPGGAGVAPAAPSNGGGLDLVLGVGAAVGILGVAGVMMTRGKGKVSLRAAAPPSTAGRTASRAAPPALRIEDDARAWMVDAPTKAAGVPASSPPDSATESVVLSGAASRLGFETIPPVFGEVPGGLAGLSDRATALAAMGAEAVGDPSAKFLLGTILRQGLLSPMQRTGAVTEDTIRAAATAAQDLGLAPASAWWGVLAWACALGLPPEEARRIWKASSRTRSRTG